MKMIGGGAVPGGGARGVFSSTIGLCVGRMGMGDSSMTKGEIGVQLEEWRMAFVGDRGPGWYGDGGSGRGETL